MLIKMHYSQALNRMLSSNPTLLLSPLPTFFLLKTFYKNYAVGGVSLRANLQVIVIMKPNFIKLALQ